MSRPVVLVAVLAIVVMEPQPSTVGATMTTVRPRPVQLTARDSLLQHRLRIAAIRASRLQPLRAVWCPPGPPELVAQSQSWDPNRSDFDHVIPYILQEPLSLARSLGNVPGGEAAGWFTQGAGIANYGQDPFTPRLGPTIRQRFILAGTAPCGGFFVVEHERFGGPLSIVVYRGDGARLWTVAAYEPGVTDRALRETLNELTPWDADAARPVDSDSLRQRTAAAVLGWLAQSPPMARFAARHQHVNLPRPSWPDANDQVRVWRSTPTQRPAPYEAPVEFRNPFLGHKARVAAANPACEPPPNPPNPWQPPHPHESIPFLMFPVSCEACTAVVDAFESLRKSSARRPLRLVRRVCELPLPARLAIMPPTSSETMSGAWTVADFDQEVGGGWRADGPPSVKLVLAHCAPDGGWLVLFAPGFHMGAVLTVYGASAGRLQYAAHLMLEGHTLALVSQLLDAESTPEGRRATVNLVPEVAKAVQDGLRDLPPPPRFLIASDALEAVCR